MGQKQTGGIGENRRLEHLSRVNQRSIDFSEVKLCLERNAHQEAGK